MDDGPLYLYLALTPERRVTPTDGADVLESLDDMHRLAWRFNDNPAWLGRLASWRDPIQADEFMRTLFLGHGDSPLTALEFRFGSPLEVVTEIPWPVYASGGLGTLWMFLTQIERLWNMAKRIRVESARLDADEAEQERRLWEERLARLDAENRYWLHRRGNSARHLQGEIPPPGFIGQDGYLTDVRPELEDKEDRSEGR